MPEAPHHLATARHGASDIGRAAERRVGVSDALFRLRSSAGAPSRWSAEVDKAVVADLGAEQLGVPFAQQLRDAGAVHLDLPIQPI